ncbi:hypothetical protein [Paenibacillus sp. GCM10023250]|uniref:hypothetical protein n=1 Tax=Paenibacillus sp. GCM10023250 TaxID=3252648 RepID=UPI00361DA25F
MKQLLVFVLLFLLVYALDTWLDVLQGFGIFETWHALTKIKYRSGIEDYLLGLVFLLPLLISCAKRMFRKRM